jgi:transposase
MKRSRSGKRRPGRFTHTLHKPRGLIHPRVQAVGPEHFGIVAVDCAKHRFKWLLADFYGNILIPPTTAAHQRAGHQETLRQLQRAQQQHRIEDLLVAIERTGEYHRPAQQLFASAGHAVRLVHPTVTHHYRRPADPGIKTDDTDLAAIFQAVTQGLALCDPPLPAPYRELQLLARHRRDSVCKMSTLCCQIREHLHAAFPGYADLFADLWQHDAALALTRVYGDAGQLLDAGEGGLAGHLRRQGIAFQRRTLDKILTWAAQAPPASPDAPLRRRLAWDLDEERRHKVKGIRDLESELAGLLVRTPYVLLLSLPGINVSSAAELAGEAGPMHHYLSARSLSGRAGLYPSRSQSDRVDHADGPLVVCGQRRLRAVLMGMADTLIGCNHHFAALAGAWRQAGKEPRWTHVKIANRLCRIIHAMVAGGRVCAHPGIRERHYILDKLLRFHGEHGTPVAQVLADLGRACERLPTETHAEEARPLAEELRRMRGGRRRGPQPLVEVLPEVLARLGVGIQSTASGE